MNKFYVGVDNGISGSIGIIAPNNHASYFNTPIIKQLDYQKTKPQKISRVNVVEFEKIIQRIHHVAYSYLVIFERPFKNPKMFKASISAARCYESELCIVEKFGLPYIILDSKEWQKALLPGGCKGPELKDASHDIGIRLFPSLRNEIEKQKDADGILIAEYARRMKL